MAQFTSRARIQEVMTYNEVGYTYNDPRALYDGFIFTIQELMIRANITIIPPDKTITIRGRILGPQYFQARMRISRRQGWPIPDTEDPAYTLWQDTRIYSRANILHYIAFPTQTVRIKGRVTYGKTLGMQAKARLTAAQTLQSRARITSKTTTVHLPISFRVRETSQRKLRVVFYMQGAARTQALSTRASIIQTYGSRVTGHFIVPMSNPFTVVLPIADPVTSARTQQTLSTRSRIV